MLIDGYGSVVANDLSRLEVRAGGRSTVRHLSIGQRMVALQHRFQLRSWAGDIGDANSGEVTDGGTLRVERAGGFYKDRLRSYKVCVDGKTVGAVREYGVFSVDVGAGVHEVQLKIDIVGSQKLRVQVNPGDTKIFVCAAGFLKGFERIRGYIRLWEGQLPRRQVPGLIPPGD